MKDIENRADVALLVNSFYNKVKIDDKLGHIFSKIIGEDWSHHLPVMYDFWELVLFSKAGYAGNPVRKHVDVDKKTRLNKEHFDRWLELWNETIDSTFVGEYADMAKNKAMLMANLINMKVDMSRDGIDLLN